MLYNNNNNNNNNLFQTIYIHTYMYKIKIDVIIIIRPGRYIDMTSPFCSRPTVVSARPSVHT